MKKLLLLALLVLGGPVSANDTGFLWRLKPPVNSKWRLNVETKATQIQTAPSAAGMVKLQTLQTQHSSFDLEVLSRDSRGFTKFRLRIQNFGVDLSRKIDGQEFVHPGNEALDRQLHAILHVFRYKILTFTASPTGRISNVDGLEPIRRELREFLGTVYLKDEAALDAMVIKYCGADRLQGLFTDGDSLPSRALSIGQSYKLTSLQVESERMVPTYTATRKLVRRANGVASFTDLGTFEMGGIPISASKSSTGRVSGTWAAAGEISEATGFETLYVSRWRGSGTAAPIDSAINQGTPIQIWYFVDLTGTLERVPEEPGIIYLD